MPPDCVWNRGGMVAKTCFCEVAGKKHGHGLQQKLLYMASCAAQLWVHAHFEGEPSCYGAGLMTMHCLALRDGMDMPVAHMNAALGNSTRTMVP